MPETTKVYQTTSMTPDVIDRIVVDDSPAVLFDEFWAFMGSNIPVANIKEHDFKIILLMVRRQILNILERYPESKWDKIKVIEYEMAPRTDKQGNIVMKQTKMKNADGEEEIKEEPIYEKHIKHSYLLVELLNSLHSKVYLKLCQGREGFTLDALTMERSQVKQDLTESRPMVVAQQPTGPAQQSEGGWGL